MSSSPTPSPAKSRTTESRPVRTPATLPQSRAVAARQARLARLRRLTLRDRQLLAWLAEHYVLSADQIAQALFGSPRAARLRLAVLHKLDAVSRFVDVTTGTAQYLYALGPLGQVVHPTAFNDPDRLAVRPPRSSIERTERIVGSRRLAHLLGTNQLFIDLIAHARAFAGTGDDAGTGLVRWWSEQHATAAYAIAGIRLDGHGIWRAGGRRVGFFLEHDNGTEPLATVLRKLRGYERLAAFRPRYPVLMRVPSRRRETHLLHALAGVPTVVPVATGVHAEHPPVRRGHWPQTPACAIGCANCRVITARTTQRQTLTATPGPPRRCDPAGHIVTGSEVGRVGIRPR